MKNFNRVLAAAVAVPVALGQVLAISASAFNGAVTEVTTADVKYVKPDINFPTSVDKDATTITFTQESNWNEVLNSKLASADGKTFTVDAKAVANTLGGSYYASLIKDVVNASENPTAEVSGSNVTITGTADFSSYVVPDLKAKFAEQGYGDLELNTDNMKASYTASVKADLANAKEAALELTLTAGGKTYTTTTFADYLDAIYDDLSAQLTKIAADKGVSAEDAAELANIGGDIKKKAAGLRDKIKLVQDANFAAKSYDTADQVVAAAINYAVKNNIASAAKLPNTVDGLAAKYGTTFDTAVDALNKSLADADVNVKISVTASDLATLAKDGSDFTVAAAGGTYTVEFTIPDEEAAAVEEYAKAEVAKLNLDKTVKEVNTKKTVSATVSASGVVGFDVDRAVEVVLEDKATTTTTTTTEDPDNPVTTTTTTTEDPDNPVTTTTTTEDPDNPVTTTTTTTTEDPDNPVTTTTTTTTEDPDNPVTTTTTTTPAVDPSEVDSIAVETVAAEASNGVYFSKDKAFNASDLISAVKLTLKNGKETVYDDAASIDAYIGFKSTPGEVYKTVVDANAKLADKEKVGKIYYQGGVDIYYTTGVEGSDTIAIDAKPEVAVALKGDTNLNGKVDNDDALQTLTYYSNVNAGAKDVAFTATAKTNALLEKLVYFVSDVDTESKLGTDSKDKLITNDDALFILTYYAQQYAGNKDDEETLWTDVLANKYLNKD
ncbi:hypothetical protein [uncultured Ruminococcus sp.]|uniref:hypothetical protein n=1 Tax=uncultured Ruminococcus sp. TaxID=165186 RepID=UPI0025EADC75|nr:hypothetical protein [uncultured Ruminococcus sp.]